MTIRAKYTEVVTLPKLPSLPQRVINVVKAAIPIVSSGFSPAPVEIRTQRMATCKACEFWSEDAYRGSGGCTHDKCGCSIGKLFFSASECPDGRWGKYTVTETQLSRTPSSI